MKQKSIKQAELAKAWCVSRALICQYVKRGMPLTSQEDAEKWARRNICYNRIRFRGPNGWK